MSPAIFFPAIVFVAILVFGALFGGPARGHDGYENWRVPGNPNSSCCNNDDCRPTRAYLDEDGVWRAWNGKAWLRVPPERLLPTDLKRDGRSHLCEREGFVYCFSPTGAKM